MTSSAWDQRIARAEKLAVTQPATAELLKFYVEIARFQKKVYDALASVKRSEVDTTLLLPHFAPLLALVKSVGPQALAQAAGELAERDNAFQELLVDPESEIDAYTFFAGVLLQPYTESLARRSD